ncbi:MAG: hypothetical protein IJM37_10080 [Lachnospiraceae bacterium]|nr:hypothetical protein [Lachnospiraceae bacterium]
MKNIKSVIAWSIKAIAAGILAVIVLSGFVYFYRCEGIHIDNSTGATDYKWEPGQWKAQMTEGFSWLRMNNEGFNNEIDRQDKTDVLIMGSSHIEACNVAQKENVSSILNNHYSDLNVYNIGTSGHTIYRCISNLKAANECYKPDKYIIIETDRINLDIKSMQEVLDGNDEKLKSYNSGVMYYLQKIPAIKALYGQIDNWRSAGGKGQAADTDYTAIDAGNDANADNYDIILNQFIEYAADAVKNDSCKLIIFFKPFTSLNPDGSIDYRCNKDDLEHFRSACEKNNIIFVDMTEDFENAYRNDYIMVHGFTNTAVGTGHLNKYGHKILAERLIEVIDSLEED